VELEASAAKGLTRAELMARAGYRVAKGAALDGVVAVASDRYVGRAVLEGLQRAALQALSDHHGKHPAEKGLDRRALATLGDDAVVDHALQELVATSKITRAGDVIARAGWKPRGLDDIPYVAQVRASLARAGLAAPRVAEMATACGASPKELDAALKRLVELGHAVKVTSELYVDGPAMADLEARLVAYLEAKGTIDAQGFKELTGQSRKYAIPYAEHFDAKKVTLRIGDARKLRGR
jgi:selenocysteine-specific elongation factor